MIGLGALWLPILLSAILVFVVSSIIHTLSPWHKTDYAAVPNQDKVMDALRPFAIPPGDYMIPRPSSMKEMNTPEYKEKVARGPKMIVTVMPNGVQSMTSNLVGWFVYLLVVGVFAAYLAGRTLATGAEYLRVFQVVGCAAFIGYALALWQHSIWYNRKWSTTIKSTFDGLIYAALTAGVFGWLWPK